MKYLERKNWNENGSDECEKTLKRPATISAFLRLFLILMLYYSTTIILILILLNCIKDIHVNKEKKLYRGI